jgi:2-dehydropantoate 2-reductase
MKIGILGAGAMGSLVGAHLKKGGGEVFLIDINEEHMKAVAEHGLTMELENEPGLQTVFMDGTASSGDKVGVCDAVIVLVKCVDTAQAVETNRALFGKDTAILTLQNGVGSADILRAFFDEERIGFGALKASAHLLGPGRILGSPRFGNSPKGVYFSPVKPDAACRGVCGELAALLTAGGMPAACVENAEPYVWDKLCLNVMCNGIGALLQLANEDSAHHEDGRELMNKLALETCEVARAKGIDMDPEKYRVEQALGRAARAEVKNLHFVSAVRDAYYKRKTEIDFLNGAVVREGEKLGIPTPHNETVWRLVRLMQDTYDLRYTPESD